VLCVSRQSSADSRNYLLRHCNAFMALGELIDFSPCLGCSYPQMPTPADAKAHKGGSVFLGNSSRLPACCVRIPEPTHSRGRLLGSAAVLTLPADARDTSTETAIKPPGSA